MKLPEHYEKWLEEVFDDEPPRRGGARSMYRKLMADFAPAIEALKLCANGEACPHFECCGGCGPINEADEALNALKEKGLVE